MTRITPNPTRMARMLETLRSHGIRSEAVLEAMAKIPREAFLPRALHAEAYDNAALPIGENQTISQPLVVAKMTEALAPTKQHKILEIGTGCGYQCAVLAKLARRVYSIERFASLGEGAAKRLEQLGFTNIVTRVGDGTLGWPEQAPFDSIIVTAAGPKLPPALFGQLKEGGVLVMPEGPVAKRQELVRYTNIGGTPKRELLGYVDFVPLVGAQGVRE